MLMDTGGNCGAQSSTMIIRGLALDEITPKDIMKIMFKEIRIAVVVGLILAAVNTLRIYIMYSGQDPLFLSAVTGLSLIATVVIAKMLGGVLPILAKLCKLDPALMASPLITTIVDTCSAVSYTHLDVYKRQIITSLKALSFISRQRFQVICLRSIISLFPWWI